MKIIADENMPNVTKLFSAFGEVELVNGRTLTKEQVKGADVLLVRSVTKVSSELLKGSRVRFVGSATIGVDHIDTGYLAEQGIAFSSAPGCNADAVADYVFSGLGFLALTKNLMWLNKKIGVIGYGNVGKTVFDRFAALGCDVCVYDPIKQAEYASKSIGSVPFVSLASVMACDVISLHAPLTRDGDYPTIGMVGKEQLRQVKAGTAIISAGRGGVIDESALRELYKERRGDLHLIWDVWQGEPDLDVETLAIVDIATPHIAGYSKQGREKGTWMVYQAFCRHFNIDNQVSLRDAISPGRLRAVSLHDDLSGEELLARAAHAIYDVARDDSRLRFNYRRYANKTTFDWLRKHYVERDEFATCIVERSSEQALTKLKAMGF